MLNPPQKHLYNYLIENKKKEINPIIRANIIQRYLKDNELSQRALAKEIGIPHSTMQDWLLWLKINEEDYNNLMSKRLTHTEIYRKLRDNKKKNKKEIISGILKRELEESIQRLKPLIKEANTKEEIELTKQLIDICNRIQMYGEKSMKKGGM